MNCYLVRESDGLTLIDTAIGAARIILEAARHLGQPIRRILLTHAHVDHVGSVDALCQRLPGLEIVASARDAQLLAEAARGVKRSQMTLLPGEPQTPVKGGFKKLKNLPGTLVNDKDSVGSLDVIATPGHTPGHIAFLDRRDGTLYAGDALTTFKEVRLPFDPPWYFPLPAFATWDSGLSLSSGRRLSALDFHRILPGHGAAVEGAHPALDRAIARGARKLAS